MITLPDYNFPLGIPGGYFNRKATPYFPDYLINYHLHFMRYLYFMCIMNANGQYPSEISLEEINFAFDKIKQNRNCNPKIKKILIGEAPPPVVANYFYNPTSPWTAAGRPGVGGTAFTGAIQNTLFPGIAFPTKLDFLIACANEGFLLLDLFPYSIPFVNRSSLAYRTACISAFGFGSTPFPISVSSFLNQHLCCIEPTLTFGFALKTMGNAIVNNAVSVANFDGWCVANGITLNPIGTLDLIRPIPTAGSGGSNYLRVCGMRGPFGPTQALLMAAGF
jgi:hypothetical protein